MTLFEALKDATTKDRVAALEQQLRLVALERAALAEERARWRTGLRAIAEETVHLVARITREFVVFATLWLGLWQLRRLEHAFPLNSHFAQLLPEIHGWAAVGLYALLSASLLWDIIVEKFGARRLVSLVGKLVEQWLRSYLRKVKSP